MTNAKYFTIIQDKCQDASMDLNITEYKKINWYGFRFHSAINV